MKSSNRGILLSVAQLLQALMANAQALASISTVTIRIPIGTCAFPPSYPTIVSYTTNISGSIVTTSSTSYVTEYPGTEILYTSTDSQGSVHISSKFSPYTVPGPSSSPSPGTATSSVTATSATSSSGTGSPTSSIPTSVAPTAIPGSSEFPCPASIDQLYTSPGGGEWELFCSGDFVYNDLPALNTTTFPDCLDACLKWVPEPAGQAFDQPCVAVTWEITNPNGANCNLKYAIESVIFGTTQFESAKLLNYNPPLNSVAVTVVSSTTGVITSVPASTHVPSSTSFASYQSPSPCPYVNNSIYTDSQGVEYQVECGIDYEYDDLPSVNVDTFANCMLACSEYVPAPLGDSYDEQCIACTYVGYNANGNNCYLKSAISMFAVTYRLRPRSNGYTDSARRVGYNPASSLSSSTITSTTISISSSSSSFSTTSSFTSLPISSSSLISSSSSTATSSTSSTSVYTGTTTIEAPSTLPTSSGYPCPTGNETVYDSLGYCYYIQCNVSYSFNDLPALNTDSFTSCMDACSSYTPAAPGDSYDEACASVTWNPTNNSSPYNCYLHYAGWTVVPNQFNENSASLQPCSVSPPPTSTVSSPASSSSGPPQGATANPLFVIVDAGEYLYLNCYADSPAVRVLDGPQNVTSGSVDACADFCYYYPGSLDYTLGPYNYFGVEFYTQCFCGNTLQQTNTSTDCGYPCTDNQNEICGGSDAANIYELA